MKKFIISYYILISILLLLVACQKNYNSTFDFTGAKNEVELISLNPGHFHAALVHKKMYDQVSPEIHVYARPGPELDDFLKRIEGYNSRPENPTHWQTQVYSGEAFLEKMISEKPGNVVVISGNNRHKTDYIKACVEAGLNVFADKPMCIDRRGFELLKTAFANAEHSGVLLYDIMTERYEITTILQKFLINDPDVFGELQTGTPDEPAVTKESVHHFFKYISDSPIKRPELYFDTAQQGEGLVDVTTHLVDLIQWECFPEEIIDGTKDVEMISAHRWPTIISKNQFQKVTGSDDFPELLKKNLNQDGSLPVSANGEMIYRIRGIHAKVSVLWNFEAPAGGKDTHYSIMRGTKSNIIIKQGAEQNYTPELYVDVTNSQFKKQVEAGLDSAIQELGKSYPGLKMNPTSSGWHIYIPAEFRIGHEAHFGQVTEKFLQFLVDGKFPAWEVPNMIAKYYTTTTALEMARKSD